MKYQIKRTKNFNKSIKKYKHNNAILRKFMIAGNILAERGRLPDNYRPHRLAGRYSEYMECHLRPDILLIYSIPNKHGTIYLNDIGSHGDIFG